MNERVKLMLNEFGPINNAQIEFDKYTVFIGKQGSGKSTIAKLYSMFMWMEKGLARNIINKKYITQYSRFQKEYCAYHRLDSYFKKETEIRFYGVHYDFFYLNEKFNIEEKGEADTYNVAKVMYVPAERGFLSCIDNISIVKNLPKSLETLLDEFENAKIKFKSGYKLPFEDSNFEYDALNKVSWIKGNGYKIRLNAASSGYQSVLPLTLVTEYLSNLVLENANKEDLDVNERSMIKKEVDKVMNDPFLTDEVRSSILRNLSSRFKYSSFVNVVEEMEQNLYPESQMQVLFDLLVNTNKVDSNKLLLTTHSPYIINYLTLSTKAFLLNQKVGDNADLKNMISAIVPLHAQTDPEKLCIYELNNGEVAPLKTYDGLPSDDNYLNEQLGLTNELFGNLLEIEEEFDNEN